MARGVKKVEATMEKLTEQKAEALNGRRKKTIHYENTDLIHSGCTLVNLMCSDSRLGAFQRGSMSNLIGGSSSGKTLLAKSMFAECVYDEDFDDITMVYDEPEVRDSFDNTYLFGDEFDERVNPPGWKEDEDGDEVAIQSRTVEQFEVNIKKAVGSTSCIYALDSLDAVSAKADLDKAEERMKATEKGTESKGSYGMAKAKGLKEILRHIVGTMEDSQSFLLVLSQQIDNVDPASRVKFKRAGGNALKFFANHELWMTAGTKIKKTIKGDEEAIGQWSKIQCKKNSITGKKREIEIAMYEDYGIDDVLTSLNWLEKKKFISKSGASYTIDEFNLKGTAPKIIRDIEEQGLKEDFDEYVERCWHEREARFVNNDRAPKYGRKKRK